MSRETYNLPLVWLNQLKVSHSSHQLAIIEFVMHVDIDAFFVKREQFVVPIFRSHKNMQTSISYIYVYMKYGQKMGSVYANFN